MVEDTSGFAGMPVLAFEDLFAGKLHAALDRQHPRDLYDVHPLFEDDRGDRGREYRKSWKCR